MEACWLPGVNVAAEYGRWAFTELTKVYEMESELRGAIGSYLRCEEH